MKNERMELTIKINIDTSEATEKIEKLKKQLQEILELQNKLKA